MSRWLLFDLLERKNGAGDAPLFGAARRLRGGAPAGMSGYAAEVLSGNQIETDGEVDRDGVAKALCRNGFREERQLCGAVFPRDLPETGRTWNGAKCARRRIVCGTNTSIRI